MWCVPHDESFHQVWSWYDHPLPSYSVIDANTLRDLVTLTYDLYDLGQWPYMASHVVNPCNKFEDPMAIRSWLTSSDISHRIPLTMRMQPLLMCHITWPMRKRQIFPAYMKSLIPICLFTIQLLWRYDDVQRSFTLSTSNAKAVFGRKFLSTVIIGPQNGGFRGKWGCRL